MPLPEPDPSTAARFVTLIAAGDREEAAALLHERCAPALQRKLGKLALALGGGDEADHLAHWAIAIAVTKGASFEARRGSLSSWLYFLARNLAMTQLRKLRPELGLQADIGSRARTVESRIQNREAFLRVWKRIGSEVLRQVLFLDLKHHGQAPGRAARELGLDRATFYKRRSEARRVFREIWIDEFGDPAGSFYGELE